MSPWFMIALIIAIFCILLYTGLTIFTITGLFLYHNMYANPVVDDDPDLRRDENIEFLESVNVTSIWTFVVELVVYIIMLSLSILLIVGIKKQRHQCVAPWLYVSGVITVIGLFSLYYTHAHTSDFKYILDVIVIGLQAVIWFPVFTCYKKMHTSRSSNAGNKGTVRKSVFSRVGFSAWSKNRS